MLRVGKALSDFYIGDSVQWWLNDQHLIGRVCQRPIYAASDPYYVWVTFEPSHIVAQPWTTSVRATELERISPLDLLARALGGL